MLGKNLYHPLRDLGFGKCRLNEIIMDHVVLVATQKQTVGFLHCPARSPDLLIICDHRARFLKMHYEAQVGFVESHPQSDRCDESFKLVVDESLFQETALFAIAISTVRLRNYPMRS